jgi:glycosyltransferase involved in cell wall biosynthesis
MGPKAEVSVVIPLYNKGSLVQRALESVLDQTYQNFEILVVDDGSTDHGPEVVRRFSDSRIRMFPQPNAGPGGARNRGVQESRAPYLAFLDADDEWMPRFMEVYGAALREHPECGAVIGPNFFGPNKIDQSAIWRQMGVEAGIWSLGSSPTWKNLSRIMSLFSTPGTMFRREVFERYGGFYSKDKCRFSEDKYLWLQVVLNHRVFILLESLFWYHTENSQLYPPSMYCQPGFIPPMLTDPDGIRRNCPRPFLPILQKYLCDVALGTLHENAHTPLASQVIKLMKTLPLKRVFPWRYVKARLKVLLCRFFGVKLS